MKRNMNQAESDYRYACHNARAQRRYCTLPETYRMIPKFDRFAYLALVSMGKPLPKNYPQYTPYEMTNVIHPCESLVSKSHYHVNSGLRGYLPNDSATLDSLESALDYAIALFGLGKRRARKLKRDMWLDLNLHDDFAEYVEIIECNESECADDNDY